MRVTLEELAQWDDVGASIGGVRWDVADGLTQCALHALAGARAGWAVPDPYVVEGELLPLEIFDLAECRDCCADELSGLRGEVAHWSRLARLALARRDAAVRVLVADGEAKAAVARLAGLVRSAIDRILDREDTAGTRW